jgi:hypothetical protein
MVFHLSPILKEIIMFHKSLLVSTCYIAGRVRRKWNFVNILFKTKCERSTGVYCSIGFIITSWSYRHPLPLPPHQAAVFNIARKGVSNFRREKEIYAYLPLVYSFYNPFW